MNARGFPKTALLLGIAVDWPLMAPASRWPEHGYAHLAGAAERFGIALQSFPSPWSTGARRRWTDGSGPAGENGRNSGCRCPTPSSNRISRRRVEASVPGRRALWRLSRRVPLFNPRFLEQGGSAGRPGRFPRCPGSFPRRAVAAGAGAIALLVDQFGAAYVKPVNGSLGRGILRAERARRHHPIVHNPRRGFSSPPRARPVLPLPAQRLVPKSVPGRAGPGPGSRGRPAGPRPACRLPPSPA